MTSKHTPGPWKQSKADETLVVSATHDDVAHVYGYYETGYERMAADAALIAAAPDLLKSLRALMLAMEASDDEGLIGHSKEFTDARAAIARAEGRS